VTFHEDYPEPGFFKLKEICHAPASATADVVLNGTQWSAAWPFDYAQAMPRHAHNDRGKAILYEESA